MLLRSTAACLFVVIQAGCTSALTATYLRDGLWEGSDHAADEAPQPADAPDDGATAAEPAPPEPAADPEADRERREAALAEAMNRLSRLGTLDPVVEATLVATLQRTQPEDWPVVVDEFAASLAASGPPTRAAASAPAATEVAVTTAPPPRPASADAAPPHDEPTPPAEPAAEPMADEAAPAESAPDAAPEETPAAAPPAETDPPETTAVTIPAPPPLAVRTACFASAVRAWGDVDRFAADRFRPGQEVIVYVELDNLASGESPAGHTTCIDASLKLVDGAGRTLHAWSFDPVAETCPGRRRDYFARYVLRIPESSPPGGCLVELAVTDTLAGTTATAALPLDVVAAE